MDKIIDWRQVGTIHQPTLRLLGLGVWIDGTATSRDVFGSVNIFHHSGWVSDISIVDSRIHATILFGSSIAKLVFDTTSIITIKERA